MTSPPSPWRYACALEGGRLLLTMPPPDGAPADEAPPDAVALALRLAEAEPWLAALQAWCGQPLDPQPLAQAPAAPAGAVFAGLLRAGAPQAADGLAGEIASEPLAAIAAEPATAGLAPAGTRLWCPVAWLAAQPAPPAGLLQVPALALQVELACYPADQLPADAGVAPGALLLPGAFEARWPVRLRAPRWGLAWPATWGGPGTPVAPASPRPLVDDKQDHQDAQDAGPAWRVVLAEPWMLSLPALLGWPAPDGEAAPPPLRPDGLARLQGPGVDRPGQVVPVLQGAAWVPVATAAPEEPAWT